MKTRNLYIYTILLSVTFCFTTCKKYPEDKFISLRKPEKRVIGDWKIKKYNFNNVDIIDEINSTLKTFDIRELTLVVKGNKGKEQGYYTFLPFFNTSFYDFPISKYERGKFYFSYLDKGVNFGDSLQKLLFLTPLSIKGAKYAKWDIRNLYLDKMHLQLKTDSGNYDIYFEK